MRIKLDGWFFALLVLGVSVICLNAGETMNKADDSKKVVISGAYFKAALIANKDFMGKVNQDVKDARKIKEDPEFVIMDGQEEFFQTITDIATYNVTISEDQGYYTVHIAPALEFGIKGGAADYKISKKDFSIVKRVFYK